MSPLPLQERTNQQPGSSQNLNYKNLHESLVLLVFPLFHKSGRFQMYVKTDHEKYLWLVLKSVSVLVRKYWRPCGETSC